MFGGVKWKQAGAEESYREIAEPGNSKQEQRKDMKNLYYLLPIYKEEPVIVEFEGPLVGFGGVEWKQTGAEENYGKLTEPAGRS